MVIQPISSHHRCARAALIAALLLALAAPAWAVTDLVRGQPAPAVNLPMLKGDGNSGTAALKGQTIVLIFGELYHTRTFEACRQVNAVLKDERLAGQSITSVLVVTQGPDSARPPGKDQDLPALVLLDAKRDAFGAYHVAVLPSVVVIDGAGNVVHGVAGLIGQFDDAVRDSLLLAAGKLSAEKFEETLHPREAKGASEEQVRSQRLTQLARQLARRGLDEMAAEKYAEAIKLDPSDAAARVGLGTLLLNRRRLAEAEAQFRAVLKERPGALEGEMGVAFVQTLRGGEELPAAEESVRRLLSQRPAQPRLHYLLGLILQQRGQFEDAAAGFRRAAELWMDRAEE